MSMPIFEIKPGVYYKGFWRAAFPSGDFLALLYCEDETWYFRYRFRYFHDDKVWGSKDTRSAYQMKHPKQGDDEQAMFMLCQRMLDLLLAAKLIDQLEYHSCNGDVNAMVEIFKSGVDGIHCKVMNQEQYAEYQRTGIPPKDT